MGRARSSESLVDARRRERYRVARQVLRLSATAAQRCSGSPGAFARALVEAGRDPADFEELTRQRPGGHPGPRLDSEGARARAERYRVLRELGASALFANQWSSSDAALDIGKRRLAVQQRETGGRNNGGHSCSTS